MEESKRDEASVEKEAAPQATRLMLFIPQSMKLLREETISVKALTDDGIVDTARDDLVELSINKESQTCFKNGEKAVKVQLNKGEADAQIMTGSVMETVIFRATWISGKSPLQSIVTNILVGGLLI
ncbi:hypothetical protein KEJ39_00405 [Candidatus Bathyarchaeota archaeon]|nr:hypothetical protein [Candidatus Bathyarchaeota archaeon]